jgi:curved DNA-binding protein CbpA
VHEDLYAVLGVKRGADQAEIRAAYRRLAQAHHPDHAPGPGSQAEMVAINLAYAVLGDPERRRRYDASLKVPEEPPLWAEDLEQHVDDWRQMYEEERNLWETLLASYPESNPDPSPSRQSVEAALAQTRQSQLDLENAIRARLSHLPPLSAEAFEEQRASAKAHTPRPPGGCLTLLLAVLCATQVAPLTRRRRPACGGRTPTRGRGWWR